MPMNKREKKAELTIMLKSFQDEMDTLRRQRETYAPADDKDPFNAEEELKDLIKFFTIAVKLAPKDHKKLKRLHAEISEKSNNTLELLMERDHIFAETKINIVSTAEDIYEPGKHGLGEAIRQKGKSMKTEYDVRDFLIKNWMEITR
jgi:hypothetical protein